jgi:hypothetical protein
MFCLVLQELGWERDRAFAGQFYERGFAYGAIEVCVQLDFGKVFAEVVETFHDEMVDAVSGGGWGGGMW